MEKRKLIIVEDEKNIIELVKYNFEQDNFRVDFATNGQLGYEKIKENDYDLVILDLMLPKMDGISICKALRSENNDVPIIMLTAKSEEIDKILGLELGADDYVTKPFSVNELKARIKSVLRRYDKVDQKSDEEEILKLQDIMIDINKHKVIRGEEEFDLTYKEFELLKNLVINKGRVMSRNKLLDEIWGYDYFGETRTVDVHIRHLRKKIGKGYIKTVRGIGYKVE